MRALVLATVIAAGAVPAAFAQSPLASDFGPLPPTSVIASDLVSEPPGVSEPISEPTASDSRDGELANETAHELVSEPPLKDPKDANQAEEP